MKVQPLFRQFIVDWNQEATLTDYVLMSYLWGSLGAGEVMLKMWANHMKKVLATNQKTSQLPAWPLTEGAINILPKYVSRACRVAIGF